MGGEPRMMMPAAYVSELLATEVDMFTVQKLAGHADAVTTAWYNRLGEGERRRVAAQLRIPAAG